MMILFMTIVKEFPTIIQSGFIESESCSVEEVTMKEPVKGNQWLK